MNKQDSRDYWSEDEFEDTVASAMISCYETKALKNKGLAPSDRISTDRLLALRSRGIYVPSNSRIIEDANVFDTVNDSLPDVVSFGFKVSPNSLVLKDHPDAYFVGVHAKKVDSLGKAWHKIKSGQVYEMVTLVAQTKGVYGERSFFTVTSDGEVVGCNVAYASTRGYMPAVRQTMISHESSYVDEKARWGSVALQAGADKRFCWSITANESGAKVHLGCMKEEIKSLLYARELPITATGRKKPVLHLVEAHKRRMKSGIDVNIDSFLRGVQTVEIGNTLFTVNPPSVIQPKVSVSSQKFVEDRV